MKGHGGLKSLLLFAGFAIAAVAVAQVPSVRSHLNVQSISDWVETLGIWGPVGLLAVSIVLPFLLLPRWPVAFVAGALYGIALGSVVGLLAGTLGALVHYVVSARLFKDGADRVRHRFHLPAHMDDRKAWVLIFTLRAFPLSNYGLTNLLAAALGMRLPPFAGATLVGMIPSTLMYAAWGKLLKKPSPELYALAIGLVVILTLGTWWMGRRILVHKPERTPSDAVDLAGG